MGGGDTVHFVHFTAKIHGQSGNNGQTGHRYGDIKTDIITDTKTKRTDMKNKDRQEMDEIRT